MAIHIRRREFLLSLGGAVAAWPVAAPGQQAKVPTIGALVIGNISPEEFWREFRQGLRDLGPIDPRHAAVGAPGHRSGQRDRSLLQTFPRTDTDGRRSHRNRSTKAG